MRISILMAVVTLGSAAGTASAAERAVEKTVAADPNGTVEISNIAGTVEVVGWDRPEVEVKASLDQGVERVDVTSGSKHTVVKVVLPRESQHEGEARLTVNVPRASELSVVTVSADTNVKQVVGAQRLKTVSGNINAELGGANSELKSVSGDITVRGAAKPAMLRLSTVSGDVKLERAAGEVDATSVSGDVRVEVDPASSVRLHSTSGDLGFRGQLSRGGSLEAETVNGDVELNARSAAGYEYEASSFNGQIDTCFNSQAEKAGAHTPGTRLNGTLGGGSARVRIRTMTGDVKLCDK